MDAQQWSATVREHSPLRKLTIHDDSVEVETPDERYTAAKLILVPGAWAKSMFASIGLNVPLTIIKTQECYFDAHPAWTDIIPSHLSYIPPSLILPPS